MVEVPGRAHTPFRGLEMSTSSHATGMTWTTSRRAIVDTHPAFESSGSGYMRIIGR